MDTTLELTPAGLLLNNVGVMGFFYVVENDDVLVIDLPTLTGITGQFYIYENDALHTLLAPALVSTAGSRYDLQVRENPALANVVLTAFVPTPYKITTFFGCALTQSSVDHILARFVAAAGFTRGTLDLSGGTSAAPGTQGALDKAELIARGVTVLTN
jgi:hypothetical protein